MTTSMAKELEIGYLTDDPAKEYGKAIRKATNKTELITAIQPYKRVADDALRQAESLSKKDFEDFSRMIKRAHKVEGEEAEEFVKRFGDIALPIKMMTASMVADRFHAPWGTAVIRCEEEKWSMI